MTPQERTETVKRYADRQARWGATAQTLGWRDAAQQALRFAVLAEVGDLSGRSVLDVGCGFGDFYGYLLAQGRRPSLYVGVDVAPSLLQVARERHPGIRFEERDIVTQPMAEQFDYVVESGVLNHRLQDNEQAARAMLEAMYRLSRRGMAANLMSFQVDYTEPHLYYYDPEATMRYCRTLSRFVTLRHDYPLYEFTIYLYRQPLGGAQ
ncbi:MAG: class I SAM-dependent methyltransferase [Candidatus Omnitrophica bacterium]|nr:class I SAM-dependent methyltransferase [Candidatus Omnitrophota bacterium]